MMGGRIWLESATGVGSTFHFTACLGVGKPLVAAEPVEKAGAADHRNPADRSLRILLAEDNPVNQKVAVHLLEKQGHAVVVAGTGQDALAASQFEPFDLILMDIQMPELDGLEATRAIREREQNSGVHVPIIAMTAHAMKGDRELCLQAGMDSSVSKPISAEELFAAMEQAMRSCALREVSQPALPVSDS